jgi:hypothetical protein
MGYGWRRSPLGFSGNARLEITAPNLIVCVQTTEHFADNSLRALVEREIAKRIRLPDPPPATEMAVAVFSTSRQPRATLKSIGVRGGA